MIIHDKATYLGIHTAQEGRCNSDISAARSSAAFISE